MGLKSILKAFGAGSLLAPIFFILSEKETPKPEAFPETELAPVYAAPPIIKILEDFTEQNRSLPGDSIEQKLYKTLEYHFGENNRHIRHFRSFDYPTRRFTLRDVEKYLNFWQNWNKFNPETHFY